MKRLVITALLSIPAVASADKNFLSAGGAHDCASDPVVNISSSAVTVTLTGACTTVNVNGSDNKVTIASVGELNINGSMNKADVDELGGANANGSKNQVTYKKAQKGTKPGWRAVGVGNAIAKAKAAPDKPADKPAEKGGKKS